MDGRDFIEEIQELTDLVWTDIKISPGTPGCFLKAYREELGVRIYYKISNYDSYRGVFGHECVNELIVSRLLSVLEIEHLEYQLIHARILVDGKETETYITRSVNFRRDDERKMAFDVFYDLNREEKESPLDFAVRMGWEKYVYQMIVVDYLICNRDRHGANIEILVDPQDRARPAPLFDQGLSLLFSCYGNMDSIRKFDVMEDRAVNNYIGSRSLEYNLGLLPKGERLFEGRLKKGDRERILAGLDTVSTGDHLGKIWDMIWGRWNRYVQVCHQESRL